MTYLRPHSSDCRPTVSVCLGRGGGGLPLSPRAPPTLLYLYVLVGGLVLFPGPLREPPNPLSLSVLVGGVGVLTRSPSCTPTYVVSGFTGGRGMVL